MDGTILVSFYPQFEGHWAMRSEERFSPLRGKEYIFGRDASFGILQDFYYASVKPDGRWDKRITGMKVPRNISRVHYYVRDLDNEIQIARLGVTPINIEFYDDYRSNVWL